MKFSDKQLNSFQKIYQERFGVLISKSEAAQKAEKLVRFVKAVKIGHVKLEEYNR